MPKDWGGCPREDSLSRYPPVRGANTDPREKCRYGSGGVVGAAIGAEVPRLVGVTELMHSNALKIVLNRAGFIGGSGL